MSDYNGLLADIEELIGDFIMYRKSKNVKNAYSIQSIQNTQNNPTNHITHDTQPAQYSQEDYEIGKGWPHYKNVPVPGALSNVEIQNMQMPNQQMPNSQMPNQQPPNPALPTPEPPTNQSPKSAPPVYNDDTALAERDYSEKLYCQINAWLKPYVDEVLDEYEYESSPAYEHFVTKETIAEMVARVIDKAKHHIMELEEISVQADRMGWSQYKLLCAVIEAQILCELYCCRRPKVRNA